MDLEEMSLPPDDLRQDELLPKLGLKTFRPGQREIIQSVFEGADCLCIMPTGGGKSLCYQFPAIARPGLTLVVSPLIALMKDQVDSLLKLGIRAACINSSQTADYQTSILTDVATGRLDLLYVAPERLRSPKFTEVIAKTCIQLLAIDEAHCISQWGHDFRPDYARLGQLRRRIGNPQTIALTATATRNVQDDIARQLELQTPKIFVNGFARNNLSLRVQHPSGVQEKNRQLIDFLETHPGSGIIYASTRKKCDDISMLLASQSRRFGVYHGGLLAADREQVQNDFMCGKLDVIIATNAFGMGIDKPDIRFIVHYNIPGTLEAYYQEAGRAGRDGKHSECLLLFSNGDRFIQEFFIENAYPARGTVEKVYEFLRKLDGDPIELTLNDIKETLQLEIAQDGIGVCEQLLEKAGAIERLDSTQNLASIRLSGNVNSFVELLPRESKIQRKVLRRIESLIGDNLDERFFFHPRQLVDENSSLDTIQRAIRQLCEFDFFDYVPAFRGKAIHMVDRSRKFSSWKIDFVEMERRKQLEFDKLQTVVDFANARQCRQMEILEYFGDPKNTRCEICDNCLRRKDAFSQQDKQIDSGNLQSVYHCVRIVLSGVARSRSRYGKSLVAKMLWGSNSGRLQKTGLNKLSTFGLLKFLDQPEIEMLIDGLIAARLVRQQEKTRFRPTISITEAGKKVMSGRAPLEENFSISNFLAQKIEMHLKGTLGPDAINSSNPATDRQAIVPLTESEWVVTNEVPHDARATVAETFANQRGASRTAAKDEWYWTIELLDRGFLAKDVMEIRRLAIDEFFVHLLLATESRRLTDPGLLFTQQQCFHLAEENPAKLDIDWIPAEYAQNAVKLYKKIRRIA